MIASNKKTFYYHAHANALGGTLRQPVERVVATNASASLATAGGFHTSRVEKFHLDGLVSAEAAYVRVSGSEHVTAIRSAEGAHTEHRSWRTVTAATIERLNVLEVLTADRVVAQVSVDHPQDGGPSRISLLGSRFENLRVHGTEVRPKLNPKIFGAGRKRAVGNAADNSPLSFEELLSLAEEQHEERAKRNTSHARFQHGHPRNDLEEKGSALCTLVQEVDAEAPAESFSHILHVPDFGNVFLGELLVSRFAAQLTMLRIEMGCMADGDLSGGSVYSNGRPMP